MVSSAHFSMLKLVRVSCCLWLTFLENEKGIVEHFKTGVFFSFSSFRMSLFLPFLENFLLPFIWQCKYRKDARHVE